MKKTTIEWIAIAEGDWATANREKDVKDLTNYRAICFHAQQCAEKYLKAYLQERGSTIKRTHDLKILLDEIVGFEPEWKDLEEDCIVLTDFAVAHRYPGIESSDEDASDALTACQAVRATFRAYFQLAD